MILNWPRTGSAPWPSSSSGRRHRRRAPATPRISCRGSRRAIRAAESELVARFSRGLLLMLRRLVQNPALADDLHQETLALVIEKIRRGEVREPEKLAGFIRSTARNLFIADRRKEARYRALDEGEEDGDRVRARRPRPGSARAGAGRGGGAAGAAAPRTSSATTATASSSSASISPTTARRSSAPIWRSSRSASIRSCSAPASGCGSSGNGRRSGSGSSRGRRELCGRIGGDPAQSDRAGETRRHGPSDDRRRQHRRALRDGPPAARGGRALRGALPRLPVLLRPGRGRRAPPARAPAAGRGGGGPARPAVRVPPAGAARRGWPWRRRPCSPSPSCRPGWSSARSSACAPTSPHGRHGGERAPRIAGRGRGELQQTRRDLAAEAEKREALAREMAADRQPQTNLPIVPLTPVRGGPTAPCALSSFPRSRAGSPSGWSPATPTFRPTGRRSGPPGAPSSSRPPASRSTTSAPFSSPSTRPRSPPAPISSTSTVFPRTGAPVPVGRFPLRIE